MLLEKYSTSSSNERNSRLDKSHKPLPKGTEGARLSYANTMHELLEHTNSTARINTIHYFALRHEQKKATLGPSTCKTSKVLRIPQWFMERSLKMRHAAQKSTVYGVSNVEPTTLYTIRMHASLYS